MHSTKESEKQNEKKITLLKNQITHGNNKDNEQRRVEQFSTERQTEREKRRERVIGSRSEIVANQDVSKTPKSQYTQKYVECCTVMTVRLVTGHLITFVIYIYVVCAAFANEFLLICGFFSLTSVVYFFRLYFSMLLLLLLLCYHFKLPICTVWCIRCICLHNEI